MEETGSSVDVHILTLCCKGGGVIHQTGSTWRGVIHETGSSWRGLYTKPEVAGGGYTRNQK